MTTSSSNSPKFIFRSDELVDPPTCQLHTSETAIFRRRRRRQSEFGLKTLISQEWCTGSLSVASPIFRPQFLVANSLYFFVL